LEENFSLHIFYVKLISYSDYFETKQNFYMARTSNHIRELDDFLVFPGNSSAPVLLIWSKFLFKNRAFLFSIPFSLTNNAQIIIFGVN